MIYEERRTLAHPKSADDYLKFCQTELFPELRHLGADPISLLSGLIGDPTNQHLQITAFEDMSVWEATQDKVLPLSNSMVIKESVRLIKPIASRPKSKVSAEDQRAVYGCRRFTINPADLQDFVNSSQNGIWPRKRVSRSLHLGFMEHSRHHATHGDTASNRVPQPNTLGADKGHQPGTDRR
ncbi:MAG: hypothetical protein CM1200mP22_23440 [Dehalococcoidia bacterium]|nr:MAG: hypothetical protein CM1200mP22_23440 [Dehalococcoidia bacterium]